MKNSLITFIKKSLPDTTVLVLVPIQILITAILILILSNISFLLNIGMNSFVFPIGIILSFFITYILGKRYFSKDNSSFKKNFFILSCTTLVAIIISILVAASFYDVSCDGQEYHQETIFAMTDDNWNPIKEPTPPQSTYPGLDTWVQHYAKGSETISASIYSLTNKIETGKAFNLLFILTSLVLAYVVMNKHFKIPKLNSTLIAIAIAFNPVTIYQSLSYYIDGEISSLIIITILLGILLLKERSWLFLLPFLGGIALLITFKFTAVLYAVIICAGVLVFLFIKKTNLKSIMKVALSMLTTGIIAVAFLGVNPYIFNTLNFGHPFYPLAGRNSINFMSENTPEEYKQLNKIEKIAAASFLLDTDKGDVLPRIPFQLDYWDFKLLKYTDIRVEGFGPFFMEITAIALMVSLIILFDKNISTRKKLNFVLASVIILISVYVIPESWWARYVPQLYLLTIIPVVIIFSSVKSRQFFAQLLLFFLLLNSVYIGSIYLKGSITHTKLINDKLHEIVQEATDIYVYKNIGFHNNTRRLKENNINYTTVETQEEWNQLKHSGWIFPESTFEIGYKN
jgi:hypothetical protein